MGSYKRIPNDKVIQAIQFDGSNFEELWREFGTIGIMRSSSGELIIRTEQGQKVAVGAGEWVVPDKSIGTFYPIANNVFEETYYNIEDRP